MGYAPFAAHLAQSIIRGGSANGLVIAIYGAWGAGKSTVLNFVLHHIERNAGGPAAPTIVRFNPWWFAGHEDLVRRFFLQLEAALSRSKAKRRSLIRKLNAFSEVVSELPVPYAKAVAKGAKTALAAVGAVDVVKLKAELAAELEQAGTNIIVVMDDIDRLASSEVRQLFQLVKAVADFPSVTYLLAFDRQVVAAALGDSDGAHGDEYLEKIVQVPFTLPQPDRGQLQSLLVEHLRRVLGDTPDALFDPQHWGNVYLDGIDPFITKPRHVVRLINALSATYRAVVGEVNAVDFVAIETLRIFVPAAYEVIRTSPEKFVGVADGTDEREREVDRKFHEGWLERVPENARLPARRLVLRLFPRLASVWGNTFYGDNSRREWRRQLRVCSPEAFPVFFRLAVPEGEVSASTVRSLLDNVDAEVFAARLREFSKQRREDGHTRASSLLVRVADSVPDLQERDAALLLRSLLEVGDEVVGADKRESSPWDIGDAQRIEWLVQALLERLPVPDRRGILETLLQGCSSLVTMVRELVRLGGQHGKWNRRPAAPEDRVLQEEDIVPLEAILVERVRGAAAGGTLWNSAAPLVLLDAWGMWGDREEMRREVAAHTERDEALLAFVARFTTRSYRQGMTDRVSKTTLHLDPQRIEDFFADVEAVAERLERLQSSPGLGKEDRALLKAFFSGWRARKAGKDPLMADEDD